MAGLTPTPKQQIFGSDGAPLVGGKIYTYAAGTTTPAATYTDYSAGTANTNPIILDSYGQANIWLLTSTSYKFVVKTATDTLLYTVDNISTPVDISAFASPPAIGNTTPNTGAFTTLSASGVVTFASLLTLSGLGAMKLNAGSTADRPTPTNGMIRYNTTLPAFEGYKSGAWGPIVGASVPDFLSLSTAAGALDITYSGTALPVANGGTGVTAAGTSGNVLTSNGTAWVSSTNLAIGVGQTWQDMSGSRTVGTTYTNTTGKPIFIFVTCSMSNASDLQATVGAVAFTSVNAYTASAKSSISLIVPNNTSYVISSSNVSSVSTWNELR